MKTYRKNYLPDTLLYNGITLYYNAPLTVSATLNRTKLSTIQREFKREGRTVVAVKVLAASLRGKTDLHGKPYEANTHFFTN